MFRSAPTGPSPLEQLLLVPRCVSPTPPPSLRSPVVADGFAVPTRAEAKWQMTSVCESPSRCSYFDLCHAQTAEENRLSRVAYLSRSDHAFLLNLRNDLIKCAPPPSYRARQAVRIDRSPCLQAGGEGERLRTRTGCSRATSTGSRPGVASLAVVATGRPRARKRPRSAVVKASKRTRKTWSFAGPRSGRSLASRRRSRTASRSATPSPSRSQATKTSYIPRSVNHQSPMCLFLCH